MLNTACVDCVAEYLDLPLPTADSAERCLRSNPYPGLKHLSCDFVNGVLVLRGRLTSYYLKQIAQEVVASLEGIERIDNQIQVVPPCPSRRG